MRNPRKRIIGNKQTMGTSLYKPTQSITAGPSFSKVLKSCYLLYWATVCKTVRAMLSNRTVVLSVCLPVCLSVCPVLCCPVCLNVGVLWPTVGWIKMKLVAEVGLDSGHIVLDGGRAPSQKGTAPNFRPMSVVAKWSDGSRYHLVGR